MKSRFMTIMAMSCLIALLNLPLLAQDGSKTQETTKTNDIKKLLVLTGAGELAVQIMNQIISSFKDTKSEIPEEIWQEVMQEIKVDELNDLVVPIYDKYLTHDEIKELIKFYESPLGKKLISILPHITQESMLVGQQWGREFGTKVGRKLRERGY